DRQIVVGTAKDPNAKVGAVGIGPSGYVSGVNGAFGYDIAFENVASATAAAQRVVITDTLDANKYDLSSLRLGPATIAGQTLGTEAGQPEFSAIADLRPGTNLLV